MLGDRTQASSLLARALTRAESKVVAHLPTVAETLRIDQLARQQLVGELALPKDQLGAGPPRAARASILRSLLLDGLDQSASSSPAA